MDSSNDSFSNVPTVYLHSPDTSSMGSLPNVDISSSSSGSWESRPSMDSLRLSIGDDDSSLDQTDMEITNEGSNAYHSCGPVAVQSAVSLSGMRKAAHVHVHVQTVRKTHNLMHVQLCNNSRTAPTKI